jgi:hypothetical protein
MPRLFAAFALLAFALPATADDKPKPNTLTPKEIADGWILLFDGESTFGWGKAGDPKVIDGALTFTAADRAVEVRLPVRFNEGLELSAKWHCTGEASFVYLGSANQTFHLPPKEHPQTRASWIREGEWLKSAVDSKINEAPNGLGAVSKGTPSPVQLGFNLAPKSAVVIQRLMIRPMQTSALFTGKNLDGWKVNMADPKRAASKWEVTKDGELSVKNGPGDLVSEKEFDNFVLQFECKTLGKALNSGIFFRCIPGQYQNGYEAQIQNAYKEDRTKPADFGTGAIYRRVPARKVVSNDNEWFTMTVVADGKHIATWVNGYQTVDWTDDRKENDNPRQGFRAAKGPISIQGHDPTTDILFRNIRVAQLP